MVKASFVFFIQCKLIYSQQFKPLIENCNKDKVVIVNKLISEAKLFIVSKK